MFPLINDINNIFSEHCNQPAIFNTNDHEWTKKFRDNYQVVLSEYTTFRNKVKSIPNQSSIGFFGNIDKSNKWKSVFLKLTGKDTEISEHFPETMKLLDDCNSINAFFSVFEPGTLLDYHTGPYKGVIRYHLGLVVPKDYQNCYLKIIDEKGTENKLHWEVGKDLMFDDIYPHMAYNNTIEERVILFVDIKRKFNNDILDDFNNLFIKHISIDDVTTNIMHNINSYDHLS